MPAQRHIAMRTSRYIPARRTLDSRRIRASSPQDQHLASLRERIIDMGNQLERKVAGHTVFAALRPGIDYLHVSISRTEIATVKVDLVHASGTTIIQ